MLFCACAPIRVWVGHVEDVAFELEVVVDQRRAGDARKVSDTPAASVAAPKPRCRGGGGS